MEFRCLLTLSYLGRVTATARAVLPGPVCVCSVLAFVLITFIKSRGLLTYMYFVCLTDF